MVEVHSAPGLFQRINEFPTLVDPEYTVADEARDLLKNGPSVQYLPFWVGNYVKRAIGVFITVIAIVLPLFSYGPRIYRAFVEYRLFALYKRLRVIERHLKDNIEVEDVAATQCPNRKSRPRNERHWRSGAAFGPLFHDEVPP